MATKAKSEQQATKEGITAALHGDAVITFTVSVKGNLREFARETLPASKYVLGSDLCIAVTTIIKKMLTLCPKDHVVVLPRAVAERVLLSLAAINAPSKSLPGIANAEEEVRNHEHRYVAAAAELVALNDKITSQGFSYEGFVEECNNLLHAQEAAQILRVAESGGELTVHSQVGKIMIGDCKRKLKHLPSARLHRYRARVISVTDSEAGISRVLFVVRQLVEPEGAPTACYRQLSASVLDVALRKQCLLAQLDGLELEVVANLTRVPLVADQRNPLDIEISELFVAPAVGADTDLTQAPDSGGSLCRGSLCAI